MLFLATRIGHDSRLLHVGYKEYGSGNLVKLKATAEIYIKWEKCRVISETMWNDCGTFYVTFQLGNDVLQSVTALCLTFFIRSQLARTKAFGRSSQSVELGTSKGCTNVVGC